MSITRTGKGSDLQSSSATASCSVTVASNTLLVVSTYCYNNSGAASSPSTVTWNSQSLTSASYVMSYNGFYVAEIYYLWVTSGATATLTATWGRSYTQVGVSANELDSGGRQLYKDRSNNYAPNGDSSWDFDLTSNKQYNECIVFAEVTGSSGYSWPLSNEDTVSEGYDGNWGEGYGPQVDNPATCGGSCTWSWSTCVAAVTFGTSTQVATVSDTIGVSDSVAIKTWFLHSRTASDTATVSDSVSAGRKYDTTTTLSVSIDDASSQTKAEERFYNPRFYALDFGINPPSIGNLNPSVTLNGVTQTPLFRWKGKDAASTWPYWGYGENLILQQETPDYNAGSALLGDVDGSVKFPGSGSGAYYAPSGTSLGNIGTKDLLLELVIETTNVTTDGLITKWDQPTVTTGWLLYMSGTGQLIMELKKPGIGAGNAAFYSGTTPAGLYHLLVLVNRNVNWDSGGGEFYLNGVSSSTSHYGEIADFSSSLDTATAMWIGAAWGTSMSYSYVHYIAGYGYDSWFDDTDTSKVEWAAFAKQRFAQLCGTKAIVSLGSAYPTTCTRASAGYLDKLDSTGYGRLWQVGANWPRACERKDTSGNTKRGALIEQAITNIGWHTEASGSWTMEVGLSAVPSTSITLPNGRASTTCVVKEDGTTGDHRFYEQTSLGASDTWYCMSVYAKAINRQHFCIQSTNSGCAIYQGDYALSGDGTAYAVYANTYAGIQRMCGDWYRCWIVAKTANPVSGGCYNRIYIGEAYQDYSYTGANQDAIAFWGFQVEPGMFPTSYVQSSAGATARIADSLRYNAASNIALAGSIQINMLGADLDIPSAFIPVLMSVSDGTTNNCALIQNVNGAEYPSLIVYKEGATQAQIDGTTDIWDGDEHVVTGRYKTDLAQLYVDGVKEGTDDTSVTTPTGLTRIDVGCHFSSGYEARGLVSKVRSD